MFNFTVSNVKDTIEMLVIQALLITNAYNRYIHHHSERINENNFYYFKKLFGCVNHPQLPNEYVLHNFFAFYETLIVKSN